MTNTLNKIMHNGNEYDFPECNVKIFELANNTDTATATNAVQWGINWWVPIIKSTDATYWWYYYINYLWPTIALFKMTSTQNDQYRFNEKSLQLTISSWTVITLTFYQSRIQKVSSLPASPDSNTIYLVV